MLDDNAEYSVDDPKPAAVQTDPALREIDEALADDVEHLLQGGFDTVSEVLDEIFDDQAVMMDDAEGESGDDESV